MGMEMKLNLKMAQKLVMTPMLQQAIKLLPLARLELAQLVHQEIIENPVLEEILDDDEDNPPAEDDQDLYDEAGPDTLEDETYKEMSSNPEDQAPPLSDPQNNGSEETSSQQSEQEDWDSYFQNNIDRGSTVDNYSERPGIEATYSAKPSLADHLQWQLELTVKTDEDKFIGTCLIWHIQSDGYLNTPMEDLVQVCNASEEDILRVLKVIQGFEPAGVGARSLNECLMIQAQALPERDELVENLIKNFLDRLEERTIPKIASELKMNSQLVLNAFHKIQEFDPKPGFQFTSEGIDYITPDIIVVKTDEGYEAVLNDEGIPDIRINPYYHGLLKTTKEDQTKEYLEDKYRSAMWLIKSIDQRRQTIYKVGKSIIKQQRDFLDHGLTHLKPMVLRDVAQDIEMHESTVSRITTNKYIDTPQGIFELKFFFHSGIKSYIGNNLSSIRVKGMIKEVVDNEDKSKPYTDDEMVQVLMRKNAKIARRTITKYRKELNIPPASKRKKIF